MSKNRELPRGGEKLNLAEKRRNTLISLAYFAVFSVAYYLFVKFAFWMAAPFIFAFIIAMFLQRPIRFISRKTILNRKLTSVILVLLIVLVLLGLVGLVGYRIWTEFVDFGKYITAKFGNYTEVVSSVKLWVENVLSHLPASLSDKAKVTIDGMTSSILNLAEKSEDAAAASSSGTGINLSFLATPLTGILSTARQIPAVLTAFLIGIIACFFMTSDYENFTNLIKKSVSEEHEATLVKAKHIIVDILGKFHHIFFEMKEIKDLCCAREILFTSFSYPGSSITDKDYIGSICQSVLHHKTKQAFPEVFHTLRGANIFTFTKAQYWAFMIITISGFYKIIAAENNTKFVLFPTRCIVVFFG